MVFDQSDRSELEPRVGALPLLVGLLGGAVAWTLHLMVCYFLVTLACSTGWRGAEPSIAVATAILALASAGSGLVAYRHWHRNGAGVLAELDEPRGRRRFLMLMGMALAALFAVAIVLTGLVPLFLPLCSKGSGL